MKKYIISLLVLTAFVTVRCKKDQMGDQLPPITTSGDNTFGCKVDGKVWLPYGGWGIDAIIADGPEPPTYTGIQIHACNRKNGSLADLDITLFKINDTGTYKIYDNLGDGLSYSDGKLDYNPYDTFGIVKILRCDTIQKIISGTFSFTGTNKQSNQTLQITDGRFDLHYPLTIH